MYNKRKFNKINDKKVLHKVKKQWVTMSVALFTLIGGGALVSHTTASANQMNNDNNSNDNSNTIHINNDNQDQRDTNELGIAGKAKEMHQRLLFTANNQVNSRQQMNLGSKSNTNKPTKVNKITVNNRPAYKISNTNQLRVHKSGLYHNYIYNRINLPFYRVRINHPVKLHNSADFDNSKIYGSLLNGQIVKVHRAFKEYGHYNNYLRYEVGFARNHMAFITGNPDFVSFALPSKNYKQYQYATTKLLKGLNYKNATKISKNLNKLIKPHNHNYHDYARLYISAFNIQQNLQHPVSVNYHNKQGRINNGENITFKHSRANITVSNTSSDNVVNSLEISENDNSSQITPESNTIIPSTNATSNSFDYTPASSINVIPATSASSSSMTVPSSSNSQSSVIIPSSASSTSSNSSSNSASSSNRAPSSTNSSASVSSKSQSSSVRSKASSSATSRVSSKASVAPSSTNSSISSKAKSMSNNASGSSASAHNSSSALPNEHIQVGTYYGLNYKYNPIDKNLEFMNGKLTWNSSKGSFLGDSHTPSNIRLAQSIKFNSDVNTNDVTDMSEMFNNDSNLKSLNLGKNFRTSNVTNMSGMFRSDNNLTTLILDNNSQVLPTPQHHLLGAVNPINNDSDFDTSNVNDMSYMFYNDSDLTSLTIPKNFSTNKVSNYNKMFSNDVSLKSLNIFSPNVKFDNSAFSDTNNNWNQLNSKSNLSSDSSHVGMWTRNMANNQNTNSRLNIPTIKTDMLNDINKQNLVKYKLQTTSQYDSLAQELANDASPSWSSDLTLNSPDLLVWMNTRRNVDSQMSDPTYDKSIVKRDALDNGIYGNQHHNIGTFENDILAFKDNDPSNSDFYPGYIHTPSSDPDNNLPGDNRQPDPVYQIMHTSINFANIVNIPNNASNSDIAEQAVNSLNVSTHGLSDAQVGIGMEPKLGNQLRVILVVGPNNSIANQEASKFLCRLVHKTATDVNPITHLSYLPSDFVNNMMAKIKESVPVQRCQSDSDNFDKLQGQEQEVEDAIKSSTVLQDGMKSIASILDAPLNTVTKVFSQASSDMGTDKGAPVESQWASILNNNKYQLSTVLGKIIASSTAGSLSGATASGAAVLLAGTPKYLKHSADIVNDMIQLFKDDFHIKTFITDKIKSQLIAEVNKIYSHYCKYCYRLYHNQYGYVAEYTNSAPFLEDDASNVSAIYINSKCGKFDVFSKGFIDSLKDKSLTAEILSNLGEHKYYTIPPKI